MVQQDWRVLPLMWRLMSSRGAIPGRAAVKQGWGGISGEVSEGPRQEKKGTSRRGGSFPACNAGAEIRGVHEDVPEPPSSY